MTDKWSRSAELVNQRGLHARASAAFAREASKYDARITVRYDGMSASAASIMDLLMLGAKRSKPCATSSAASSTKRNRLA